MLALTTLRSGRVEGPVIGGPDGGAQAAPTEVATFEVRLTNGDPTRTAYNITGELVINYAGLPTELVRLTTFNWGWPGPVGQLNPGQSVVGTVNYTVRSLDPNFVEYRFFGWGNYGDPVTGELICDQQTSNVSTMDPGPIIVVGPGLDVMLTTPTVGAEVGDSMTWNLNIINQRNLPTVISADDLYFEVAPCNPGPNTILLNNGIDPPAATITLAATPGPGATATASFSCNMVESYPDPVINTVTVHANASGINLDFQSSVSIDKYVPSIRVTKQANATQVAPGDTITYTIRVENDGDVPLNNVTVVDTLTGLLVGVPSQLCPAPTPPGCTGPQNYSQDVQYTVQESDADPLINIVTAFGVSPQGTSVGSNWTVSIDKTNPAIELLVSVLPTSQSAGNPVTYTFQVTNTGSDGLVGLTVNFPLCTRPGAGAGCTGNNVNLGSTSLVPGASTTGTFTYTIQGTEPDPFGYTPQTTATARATTTSGAVVADSGSAFVDIVNDLLTVRKIADRSVALRGDTINYTVTIENRFGRDLRITSVTDSLLGTIGTAIDLPDGSTQVIDTRYTVTGNDPDPLINVVTVVTDDLSTPALDDGPSDSTSAIVDISDAQLFITVSSVPPDEVSPGNPVDYSVGIANVGRVTMTNIVGTWEISGSGEPAQQFAIDFPGPGGPTLNPGEMAPFQSAFGTFDLGRPVSASDPDPLIVIVRITGRDDRGTERTFVGVSRLDVLPTQLRVTKSANTAVAAVGDVVTYSFLVQNIADASAERIDNIVLTDPLCTAPTASGCGGVGGNAVLLEVTNCLSPSSTGAGVTPLNDLADGACAYGEFTYRAQASDLNLQDSTRVNTATISGRLEVSGQTVGDASLWELQVINPLVIEKSANRVVATDGQNIEYTLVVRNIGSLNAITNIIVNDPRLDPINPIAAGFTLNPGQARTFTSADNPRLRYMVDFDTDQPSISNTATATGSVNGQNTSASSNWEVEVLTPLAGQKTGPAFAIIGDTITYRVDVMNISDQALTISGATDTFAHLPGSPRNLLSAILANRSGAHAPGDNTIQPGETSWVEYTYTVDVMDPDTLTNTFVISTVEEGDFFDTHEVEIFSPFSIIKIPDRFFAVVGEAIHYDYWIYNVAEIAMAQVTVTDNIIGPIAVRRHDLGGSYTTAPQFLPALPASPCLPPSCQPYYLESNPATTTNTYTVRPADLSSETLTNTVTARGIEPGGVTILTEETAEVQVGNPLQVVKTGPPVADVGDPVNYSVQIINTGQNDITNITAIDDQTGEVVLTWPDPANPGTLHPGQSAVGTISTTIPQAAPDPFVNTVVATGRMVISGVTYNLSSIGRAQIDITNPILAVDLIAPSSEAERNTTITWTVLITNNGTSDILDLTYQDSTGVTIPVGPGNCPAAVPALTTLSCTYNYTVTTATPDPLQNTLHVEGHTGGGSTVAAEDTEIIDLINLLFRVSKVAAPNVAFTGDTITYTITVTNSSGSRMDGVSAYDTLAGQVVFTFPGGTQGTVGSLNDSESAVGIVTYTLSQADPSPLINTVSASGTTTPAGNFLSDSTYTTVLISSSQLLVNKQATPTIVQIGQNIVYNISITNIGQTRITGLQVSDAAVGLATNGTCTLCTITTPLTSTALDPFEVAFLSYRVTATTALPDPFINTINVTGIDSSGNTVRGSDTIAVDIITPGIQVTKTADRAGASIGDTVQYTIQVTNVGATALTGIQVTDHDLNPTGPTLVPMSYNGGAPTTNPALSTLNPGQTAIGVVFYTVTASTPNPFVNTVTVTNNQGRNDGTAASIEIRNLGISVTKTPQITSAVIGETVNYDVTVTNTSSTTLTAVTAIDQLSGLPITLTFPTTPGQLAPNETATGTFQYVVPPTVDDPLQNRVTASGRAPSGVVVSSSALALVDIREADIVLDKTALNTTAQIGTDVTYEFTVSNAGTTPLSNVQVTDPLCATATSGCTGNQITLTFSGAPGTLGPSGSPSATATGTMVRRVQASDPDPLTNTATATGRTASGVTIRDTDSATVQIAASPLTVIKTVAGIGPNCASAVPSSTARVGNTVAYNVRVENTSTNPADVITGVQVLDTLTGSLMIFQSAMSDTVTLGAGGFDTGCITTVITDTTPDPLVNTVIATGILGGATVTDTSSATISIVGGNLVVTNVPSQTTARIGETVTFSVTVRNSGSSTISSLTATSPHAGGNIVLSATSLNPGQTATGSYTHTISGLDADPFESTVSVQAIAPGPTTLTDQATASVILVAPGVRITKVAAPVLAAVGTDINYSLTITNTGTENITDIVVIDPLLGGDITAEFPSVSAAAPLIPGASVTALITRTVTANDGDPVTNVVSVTATTTSGATLTDTASATVNIAGSGLTVIKTANVAAALNGDTITYTLNIFNTSTTTVSNLTVADTLNPSVTLPRTSLAAGSRMTTTYTHTVDTSVDRDPIENVVVVAGRDALGVPVNDVSSASVTILDNTNIRVVVTPDRATVLATQAINYLVTVTNIGTEALTSVQATATKPDASTENLAFATTVLQPGESVTGSFSYVVRVSDTSPIRSRVTAQGTGATAGTVTDTGSGVVELTTSSISSDLRTSGCSIPCVAVVGDTINFMATIFNDGATTLVNVSMTSPLPITTTEQTTGLILAPGDRATIHFSYLIPLGVTDPLEVAIHVQGIDTVGVTVSHNFSLLLNTASPRIGVTLTADRSLAPEGATITYSAEISNVGNKTLSSIAAIDSLFGPVTDRLPTRTLTPGQSMVVTYQHVIAAGDLDPLVNTLTVSGTTSFSRSVTDNDTYILNVQRPEIFITIAASRQVANVGDRIEYRVTILNIGDGPITELRGTYLTATTQGGTGGQQHPNPQGGILLIQVPFGTLNEGAFTVGSFGHVVTSGDNNPLTFRVTVSGQGLVGTTQVPVTDDALISIPLITVDASGNPIIVGTPVPGVADPEVTKETDQPFAAPGGLVTWQVNVRNPGTDPLSNIIITDTLTSNMSLESVTITNGTIQSEGNAIVATSGTLQFNETTVLTIIARVDEDVLAGEIIQNIGCATSVGGTSSICDTAMIRVAPEAELLPATGLEDSPLTGATGAAPFVAALLALLLLGGLFGINLKDPDPGTRLVLVAALIAAAVVIITLVAALVINLSASLQQPVAEGGATQTATMAAMVEGPAVAPSETPPGAATEPPIVAPTAIPIPTAGPVLPPTVTPTVVPPFRPQYERELFIPRLGLGTSVPIVEVPLRNHTWDVRDLGQYIGFLQGTTWISEADEETGGNTVLAGHIQITEGVPGPFRDLDLLEVGDSVFVAEQGTIYEYAVTEVDVVAPDDVAVTYPTREPTLTLLTCTTWNEFRGAFAERLVVRAVPVRSLSYQ